MPLSLGLTQIKRMFNCNTVGTADAVPVSAPRMPSTTIGNATYLRDPMRCGDYPDYVGSFFDPMTVRGTYTSGHDVTNTGA
ncbi:uncharacterized protein BYT42DRAFT_569298 [Radiomyces spectabilis]|uniref:uncharacterized protein n=1 Tax=Radiomyces spectabilis TaxID=64574 RepID=UPI00221E5157|nr:uncharacterized protein BYT42DRAFT_569298 [Radiomyces spectabilis]KAI8379583.1 hypothetical protein BYT42DRAFT_569298 [Radiomyces spectabilis]